jgi:serine/threonine protein phosphatase PrpC
MEISHEVLSFIGKRETNQDYCSADKIAKNTWLFAVSDGMGGSYGGETASRLIVETVIEETKKHFNGRTLLKNKLKPVLLRAFHQAQLAVKNQIVSQPELSGMGATLVTLLVHEGVYIWANIGDSRLYRLQDGEIELLTRDHTFVQDYLEKTQGDDDAAKISSYDHLLLKCIDGGTDLPDIYPNKREFERMKKGVVFMLCTDGLVHDKINTNTNLFKNYIAGCPTLKEAGENLIAEAWERGSNDNISLILAETERYERTTINLKKYSYPPGKVGKRKSGSMTNFVLKWFKTKH